MSSLTNGADDVNSQIKRLLAAQKADAALLAKAKAEAKAGRLWPDGAKDAVFPAWVADLVADDEPSFWTWLSEMELQAEAHRALFRAWLGQTEAEDEAARPDVLAWLASMEVKEEEEERNLGLPSDQVLDREQAQAAREAVLSEVARWRWRRS
jgi:hypothetical protein